MDAEYNIKLGKVLKKLLEPDFKVKDDVYLNSLLTHLITDPENGANDNWKNVTKQYLPCWICEAISQWEKQGTIPSSPIVSFTLNLASFLCKNEQIFVTLNSHNVYERLITLISVNKPSTVASIKLGYIKLVSSFLEHKSGLQWIISTNYWAHIICLTLKNQTIYISKEGYQFIAKLLVKSIKINECFCLNVMKLIMAPIGKNAPCVPVNAKSNGMEVRDQAIYQSLCSSLVLLTEVFQMLLENITEGDHCKVMILFKTKFDLEKQIRCLLLIAHNEEFIFDLYRILFISHLIDLYVQFSGQSFIEVDSVAVRTMKLFEIFSENVQKGSVINIMKLAYIGYFYWKKIGNLMPICVKSVETPVPLLFENQLLMLQLYPIISVSLNMLGTTETERDLYDDEVRDHYIDRLLKISTEQTMRLFFQWKNYLWNNPYMFGDATLALNYLVKSKNVFKREQGVTTFQTLIYCLKDIVTALKIKPEQILVLSKEYNYMALLLETIAIFINEFNFTWRDSLESICVMKLAFEFLTIPTWPTKLVVRGLKLIDISFTKYLTPNMALLIDNTQDSPTASTGNLLYVKLHDSTWEVRDTALEVLCTLSNNANKKFPSLQNIALDAKLPCLTLKMALTDGEAYVRATAVKCLQQMVKVDAFWNILLVNGNIHEKIIRILQLESEAIVRREASALVGDIYEHQDIPTEVLTQYYDIMTHASVADLHWEVKVNALKFWEKIILHHLTQQGMIDGTFPNVTFSKELRKIVTLNEAEIKKRLIKILHQLSETGCLAVLITAVKDDCDLEVSKTATRITQNFVDLLKKYNIQLTDSTLSTPPSPLAPFNAVPSPPYSNAVPSVSTDKSQNMSPMSQLSDTGQENNCVTHLDEITESILNDIISSQDMSLLQGMYNFADEMSDDCLQLRFRQVTTPGDFLKFVNTNFEIFTKDKVKWLRGMDQFESLLDDILKEYDDNDINSMDCY